MNHAGKAKIILGKGLMFLLDDIEKIIDEHGSAPILKEHLSLIQDKAAEFERKFKLLEAEIVVLRQESAEQKADNERLEAEYAALRECLTALKQSFHNAPFSEQIQILTLLSKTPMDIDELISFTNRDTGSIRDDLKYLKKANFVKLSPTRIGYFFELTPEGRKSLKNLGLLT